MSEFQVIQMRLSQTASRRRWERAWRGLWTGLAIATAFWLLGLVTFKLLPLSYAQLGWIGLAGLAAPLAGMLAGGWRRATLSDTARWIDRRVRLKERLSTALEVAQTHDEWSTLVLRDAARHAEEVKPSELVPVHLPRAAHWAVGALALAAVLGFVPEYRSQRYLQKRNEVAVIRDVGRQLAELTQRQIQQRPPALLPTQNALNAVAELGKELSLNPLPRGDALRELVNAAEKLSKEAKELAKDPALKPLERAARASSSANAGQNPDALQKQIDNLKKSLGSDKATPEALEKLKSGLEKAQQAAAAMSDKSAANSQAAREQLSQSLASLAQEAKDMGIPLENIEAAIQALEKNQISQFLKDLDVAAEDLEKLKDTAKALAQLNQQAGQIGKDLAEQLQNGQADAARQTLETMAKQMGSGSLNAEKLERMLNEVTKALDPASQYGKVAQHLKEAAQQMQQAQQSNSESSKAQASQSLAAAAKELEKLAQEMGDAQALAASLDALGRAQMAIASGQGWGQSKNGGPCPFCGGKGCGVCQSRKWGHGSGPLSGGVGTWADENEGWQNGVPQIPVDNSGIDRPDMDSRGISDRGPGEVNDALHPTKVKGKMRPGGPMPSITLKGVSIRGQSSVKFEEAAAAAQSEAEAALNQDQVPRSYQNAVKNYFDDLKK